MEFIRPVISKEPSELFTTAFNISEERGVELKDLITKALEKTEDSDDHLTNAGMCATLVEFGETPEEIVYLACQAGRLIAAQENPLAALMAMARPKE